MNYPNVNSRTHILDSLYDEKKKLELETAKYSKNLFSAIHELSQSFLSILENYLSVEKEIKPAIKPGAYFDMKLASAFHDVCNNIQFENIAEVDLYAILNLQPTNARLILKTGERTRMCYLIHKLYEYLKTDNRTEWRNVMLKTLEIRQDFYKSKYKEAASELTGRKSDSFARRIDEIFKL